MTIALAPIIDGLTSLLWTTPSGYTAVMDDTTDIIPLWGQSNFRAPPVSLTTSPLPRKGGSVFLHVRRLERNLELPILIRGATEAELWDRVDQLSAWLDPMRGAGRLTVTRPNGTRRQAEVYYSGGLELTEDAGDARGFSYVQARVVFRMPDPLWKDEADQTTVLVGIGTARPFLSTPFLPLKLTTGHILMSGSIINDGTAEAWPVWTIPGPGSNIAVRNLTTGESFTIGTTLSPTQIMTVDTRGDRPVVQDQGGQWLGGTIRGGSTMFPLAPGMNSLQVEIDENTVGATVSVAWRRQWMSC